MHLAIELVGLTPSAPRAARSQGLAAYEQVVRCAMGMADFHVLDGVNSKNYVGIQAGFGWTIGSLQSVGS